MAETVAKSVNVGKGRARGPSAAAKIYEIGLIPLKTTDSDLQPRFMEWAVDVYYPWSALSALHRRGINMNGTPPLQEHLR